MGNAKFAVKLPTKKDIELAKNSSRTLAKYAGKGCVRMKIQSDDNPPEDVVLPGEVLNVLINIMAEISRGNAFSIIPVHAELSTQEAAAILNVSRPFLISLLEDEKIPYRQVGSHRRILAEDVLAYKSMVDRKRKKTLSKLTELSQELGMGYED